MDASSGGTRLQNVANVDEFINNEDEESGIDRERADTTEFPTQHLLFDGRKNDRR